MAKKFYVVWEGRKKGIFTDWETCRSQVDKYPNPKYKSFKTLSEAENAFKSNANDIIKKKEKSSNKQNTEKIKTYSAKEIQDLDFDTKIFTDGACEPNPGEAGSGIAIYRNNIVEELWYGIYSHEGTNNTAELNALDQALLITKKELTYKRSVAILCDSKYSIQCITEWANSWEKNKWGKKGGDIKNLELIKKIFYLYQEVKNDVSILHVNGHVGVEGNELADRMSIVAITKKNKGFMKYESPFNIQYLLGLRAG